jgi:outer membrane protein assembly factor BamB
MFGLMEFTVQLQEPVRQAIIPTFILPFTVLGMILTGLATWVAAFFGIKLKAEGPKRLFEILMKPKVLIWGLISNLVFYGVYAGSMFIYHGPRPLWLIHLRNQNAGVSPQETSSKAPSATTALRPRTLKGLETVWQTQVGAGVFGGITGSGDSLFMGTDGGRFLELDANTGAIRRNYWVGQPVMTEILLSGDFAYFGEGVHDTHHARYFKFDLHQGKITKSFSTRGHIERTATATTLDNQEVLLIPAGRDGVYAVKADSMEKLWQAKIGHVDSYPVTDGKQVFVGTGIEFGFKDTRTKAYALDLLTGKVNWERSLPTSAWGKPIVWRDFVCFSVGDIYQNTKWGQISCYRQQTGEDGPSINLGGAVLAAPILIRDHLVLSDLQGTVYQVNLSEKKIDWRIQLPFKRKNYAAVQIDSEGHLIMPADDGIYVYSLATQELLFHWQAPKEWKTPYANVLFFKGLWVIADGRGQVFALRPSFDSKAELSASF